jgi:RNA polymerase sigma-70 factor (ECF subfamily)
MREHERPLYRYLVTVTRDVDLAEECAQDAFLRAYEQLRGGRGVTSAWLYKVARNRAMDTFRRRRRQAGPDALQHLRTEGETGAVELDQAMLQLSRDERALLYLAAVEALSVPEIAERLGVSVGATYTRLSRARDHLRRLLRGDDARP